MSTPTTFTSEGDPNVKEVKVKSVAEERPKNAFDEYVQSMNKEYAEICKKMAQENEYEIKIRYNDEDKIVKFRRKHMTQRNIDECEDLRIAAKELTDEGGRDREAKAKNREWYLAIGRNCLQNVKENRMMNEDDYDNSVSNTLRAVLDGSIMSEMSGVPN